MHAKSRDDPSARSIAVNVVRLYYATFPAPKNLDRETLQRLVAVHFTTEQDACHAAALVLLETRD